jgi:hypothetical protein
VTPSVAAPRAGEYNPFDSAAETMEILEYADYL